MKNRHNLILYTEKKLSNNVENINGNTVPKVVYGKE